MQINSACAQENKKLRVLINDGHINQRVGAINKAFTSSATSTINVSRLRHKLVRLSDVLDQEVGVQTRSSGGVGSFSTVSLRGASSDQVMIYLDGVPLNNADGSPVDLSLISPDSIERIDVYRGSTPLELGSPSIGGAINIITRHDNTGQSAFQQTKTDANLSIGSFHTYKLSASSSLLRAKNRYLFSASYLQSKNDFSFKNDNGTPLNPQDDRVEKRRNDGVKHLSLLANWRYRISLLDDTELRLDISDRNKQLPSVTNSAAVQTYIDTRQYHLLGQINLRKLWLKQLNANIKLFASRKNEIFDDSLAQPGFIQQRTDSVTEKAGTQLFFGLHNKNSLWKLLSGFSLQRYHTQSTQALVDSDTNTRKRLALSVQNNRFYDDNRFIITLTMRYQQFTDSIAATTDIGGNITPGSDKNYHFYSPQLGLKYRFNKHTFLTANTGRYHRVPSFFELFGGSGLVLGNPDLQAEVSLNSDAGLTYTWFAPHHWWHNAELYGGVFVNRVQDLIVQIYNGQGIAKSVNIADARLQGMETTLKLVPGSQQTIHAGFTYTDSINQSLIGSFNGKSLPNYYRQKFSLRYRWRYQQWLYRLEAELKRNMFYDRSNLLKGDDVSLVNAGVRYYFHHASVDFSANNLLDENIRYFRNRPTPGLNFSLSLNVAF